MREVTTTSPEETAAFGRELAGRLGGGGVVLLSGPLGAGKTLLAKAVFGALGADERRVVSPTFTLINRYRAEGEGLPLYHVDLYRTEGPADLETLGLEEVLDSGGVVLIEWGEKLGPGWGTPDFRVTIEDLGGEERRLRIDPW